MRVHDCLQARSFHSFHLTKMLLPKRSYTPDRAALNTNMVEHRIYFNSMISKLILNKVTLPDKIACFVNWPNLSRYVAAFAKIADFGSSLQHQQPDGQTDGHEC